MTIAVLKQQNHNLIMKEGLMVMILSVFLVFTSGKRTFNKFVAVPFITALLEISIYGESV